MPPYKESLVTQLLQDPCWVFEKPVGESQRCESEYKSIILLRTSKSTHVYSNRGSCLLLCKLGKYLSMVPNLLKALLLSPSAYTRKKNLYSNCHPFFDRFQNFRFLSHAKPDRLREICSKWSSFNYRTWKEKLHLGKFRKSFQKQCMYIWHLHFITGIYNWAHIVQKRNDREVGNSPFPFLEIVL